MVYSAGNGVHMFTLDPVIGEYRLINHDVATSPVGKYYSVNESYYNRWGPGMQQVVRAFQVFDGIRQGKRQLLHRRRPGLGS